MEGVGSVRCFTLQMVLGPSWAREKLGSRSFIWVCHMDGAAQGLGLSFAVFPGILASIRMGTYLELKLMGMTQHHALTALQVSNLFLS